MKETHTMPNGDMMPGASHSPNKMIGGVVGALGGLANLGATSQQTGALSGMTQQPGQMQQSPINPVAMGGMQSQMPNMFGMPQPMQSFNNIMPQNK